mgnify:CR=1 FL=1
MTKKSLNIIKKTKRNTHKMIRNNANLKQLKQYLKNLIKKDKTLYNFEEEKERLLGKSKFNTRRYKKIYESKRLRLEQLAKNKDNLCSQLPSNIQTFESFVKKVPEWNDSINSFVLFRDHEQLKEKESLVQRAQKSGLCYMHAPVVMQHYLVAMNSINKVGMIDITKFINEFYTAKQIWNHIISNDGGSSHLMLKRILSKGCKVDTVSKKNLKEHLNKYGPILLSNFDVKESFLNINIHSHFGIDSSKSVGQHAMLIIGHRTDLDGKDIILVQNWWEQKQFLEMDLDYMEGSSLYFVESAEKEIPSKYDIEIGLFAENESPGEAYELEQ